MIDNRKKLRWNRMHYIGFNLTNNDPERFHQDLKETYIGKHKLKLSEFLLKCGRFISDYSIDHAGDFLKPIEIPIPIWKKALRLLKDGLRGPYYDIISDYSLL